MRISGGPVETFANTSFTNTMTGLHLGQPSLPVEKSNRRVIESSECEFAESPGRQVPSTAASNPPLSPSPPAHLKKETIPENLYRSFATKRSQTCGNPPATSLSRRGSAGGPPRRESLVLASLLRGGGPRGDRPPNGLLSAPAGCIEPPVQSIANVIRVG